MKVLLFTQKKDYIKVIGLLCKEIHKSLVVEEISAFQLANIATSHPNSLLILDDRLYHDINKECLEVLIRNKVEVMVLMTSIQSVKRYLNLNIVDYFVSPLDWQAIDMRLRKQYKKHIAIQNLKHEEKQKKIVVKSKTEVFLVPEDDILFFEKRNKEVLIHTYDRIYVCHESLKEIMHHLSENFIRVHSSYIVNFNNAKSVISSGNRKYWIAFENYEDKAHMSRNRAEEILKDAGNHYRLSYITE